jgi:thiamine biosynthesis protein ThiS
MLLEINGETRSLPAVASVGELLQSLGVARDRVAVELNRRIVRRQDWADTPVREMDKIEIVQFVGGG